MFGASYAHRQVSRAYLPSGNARSSSATASNNTAGHNGHRPIACTMVTIKALTAIRSTTVSTGFPFLYGVGGG